MTAAPFAPTSPETDGESAFDDGPSVPPELQANVATRRGFPHSKAIKAWERRLAWATKIAKPNAACLKRALARYGCNDASEVRGGLIPDPLAESSDVRRFIDPKFFSDVNLIVSALMYRDADAIISPAKGDLMKQLAEATEKLAERAATELHYLEQKKLAVIEAIFRNHGYMRQEWDHCRWLPKWTWCQGEVYIDPDCGGDLRRARWIIETTDEPLDGLLADPGIAPATKRLLKETKDCHDSPWAEGDDGKRPAADAFDEEPGLTKVQCYRVWCRDGLLPGYDKDETDEEDPEDRTGGTDSGAAGLGGAGAEKVGGTNTADGYVPEGFGYLKGAAEEERASNMHAVLHPEPETRDDASPEAQPYRGEEGDRRVYALFARNMKRVLKVTSWPMDHFDRDEFPYVECRLTSPTGDIHGVALYQAIESILDARRDAFVIWFNDLKKSKNIVEVQRDCADAKTALEKNEQWTVAEVDQIGQNLKVTEIKPQIMVAPEIIPALDRDHDTASGITDIRRGQAGAVQKTATEAQALADESAAAFGYLESALEKFDLDEMRMRVAALQRYVPRESAYAQGCAACSPDAWKAEASAETGADFGPLARGTGVVTEEVMADSLTGATTPQETPCVECGGRPAMPHPQQPGVMLPPQKGNGWDAETFAEKKPTVKGADWWLPTDLAGAWRDDLGIEEIRSEIIVQVDPGSGRRDHRERQTMLLRNVAQDVVTFLQAVGGPVGLSKWRALSEAIVQAAGVRNPERFLPTDDEIGEQAAQQAQMAAQQQAANVKPPPGPPPGPTPAEQQAAQRDAEMKQADFALRHREATGRMDVEHRKVALAERQATAQNAPQEAVAAVAQQTMQALAQGVAAALQGITQAVQQVAALVGQLQAGAAQNQAATAEVAQAAAEARGATVALAQAAQVMAQAAAAPKRITRDADGKATGVEVVPSHADGTESAGSVRSEA